MQRKSETVNEKNIQHSISLPKAGVERKKTRKLNIVTGIPFISAILSPPLLEGAVGRLPI
jgi:hypothetical protein